MQARQQEVVDAGPRNSLVGPGCGLRGVENDVMQPVAGTVLAPPGHKVHWAAGDLAQFAHQRPKLSPPTARCRDLQLLGWCVRPRIAASGVGPGNGAKQAQRGDAVTGGMVHVEHYHVTVSMTGN